MKLSRTDRSLLADWWFTVDKVLLATILVLAAGSSKEGPGPLVSSIAGKTAAFPIPVTVVPQNLSDEDIESLA